MPLDLASSAVVPLTSRQPQLVSLLGHGFSNTQIARALGISALTVRTHLHQVYGRLGVASREEAVARVGQFGPTRSDVARPEGLEPPTS